MSLLTIEHLNKSYFGKSILKDLNLVLNRGDRLALIGPNGAGKTTLFRLIAGYEQPDQDGGKIQIAQGTVWAYFEQNLPDFDCDIHSVYSDPSLGKLALDLDHLRATLSQDPQNTEILDAYAELDSRFTQLGGYDYHHRMQAVLQGLGLAADLAERPPQQLSGGEKMRIQLARLLLKDLDLLLLDEPTNHLDADAIDWLSDYLQHFSGSLIVISHDRAFLDQVATTTAEIQNGRVRQHPGNYSQFKVLEIERLQQLRLTEEKLKEALAHEQEVAQTLLSHRKMTSYHSREKKVEKLREELADLQASSFSTTPKLHVNLRSNRLASDKERLLCKADKLSWTFSDCSETLFQDVSFEIYKHSKIVFVGPNGAGKTTLLNAIYQQSPELKGKLRYSESVVTAYMGQLINFDHPQRQVLEELRMRAPELTEGAARNLLAAYGFPGTAVYKQIDVLSGGERSRLYLCLLLLAEPDLLFLDEPTNHLDIHSREILEQALKNYQGALICVSHDRYFIEQLAAEIYALSPQGLVNYPSYQSYRKQKSDSKSVKLEPARSGSPLTIQAQATNHLPQEKLWSTDELQLWPGLAKIALRPKNRVQERRFTALLGEVLKNLEQRIAREEEALRALEDQFALASGPEIYENYAEKQLQVELLSDLYLKALAYSEENPDLN